MDSSIQRCSIMRQMREDAPFKFRRLRMSVNEDGFEETHRQETDSLSFSLAPSLRLSLSKKRQLAANGTDGSKHMANARFLRDT